LHQKKDILPPKTTPIIPSIIAPSGLPVTLPIETSFASAVPRANY